MKHQPKSLRILIPTEMAATYSYFALQAILVFYLIQSFSFSDARAYAFSGQFITLAYIMPLVGGWLADHLLGHRRAIWIGGWLLCSGYALLALGHQTLLSGLSLVVVGNGLFKPTLASFTGEFYQKNDPRRAAGFTLIYTGMSIGSLLAISSVGYLKQCCGWAACFGVASFSLLLGMSVFRLGFRYFADKGLPPPLSPHSLKKIFRSNGSLLVGLGIIFILVLYAMKNRAFGNNFIACFGGLFCLYLIKIAYQLETKTRRAVLALMILFVIAILYKAMFFETYLAVNVFTDRLVDRHLLGYELPAATLLSLSSFFTIILGPLFAWLWQSNKINFSITFKFSLGLLIIGVGMEILALWVSASAQNLLPIISMVIFRFIFSLSELFILPLGIAVVSEYAPKECVSVMMGGWYLTAAFGGKLAGFLAIIAAIPTTMTNILLMKHIYAHAFQSYALLDFSLFALCLMLIPLMRRLLPND